MLSVIADIFGILSFVCSIILWIKSDALSAQIDMQKGYYIKEQKAIRQRLTVLRAAILEDGLTSRIITSDIRTELYTYRQNYSRLLNPFTQCRLLYFLQLLDKPLSDVKNKEKVIKELDYFIARFSKKEAKNADR